MVVFGAGGQARELMDFVSDMAGYETVALVDRDKSRIGETVQGVPVVSSVTELPAGSEFLGVLGSGLIPLRDRMLAEMTSAGISPVTLVHPTVVLASSAQLARGAVVCPQASVMNSAKLGANCLVNVGCSIGHDCVIGEMAVLSPGVRLGGAVEIGVAAFLGLGAIVLPGVKVGERAVVGAGSVVNRDVPSGATVAGVPANQVR